MLWYAIYTTVDSADWIIEVTRDVQGALWQARLVGDTSAGGLVGCGFPTAHLSADITTTADTLVNALASALASTRPGRHLV